MTDESLPPEVAPAEPTSYTVDEAADKFATMLAPANDDAPAASAPAPAPETPAAVVPEATTDAAKATVPTVPTPPAPDAAIVAQQQQLQAALAAYTQELARMQQVQQPDWAALAAQNPAEYVRLRHEHEQRQIALTQAQQQQYALEAQQRQQFEQELDQIKHKEYGLLTEAIPEWKDPEAHRAGADDLRNYLGKLGYPTDTLESISDHREIVVARKAMLYDKMMAEQQTAKASVSKRLENLPPRVERPGTASDTSRQQQSAFNRLAKTGSVDDAAAVFANMLTN